MNATSTAPIDLMAAGSAEQQLATAFQVAELEPRLENAWPPGFPGTPDPELPGPYEYEV